LQHSSKKGREQVYNRWNPDAIVQFAVCLAS